MNPSKAPEILAWSTQMNYCLSVRTHMGEINSDARSAPVLKQCQALIHELGRIVSLSSTVTNFLLQFVLSLTKPGNYLGTFTRSLTMWVYSLQISTPVWEVLQSFGLLGSRQWATKTCNDWFEAKVFASSRDRLICRVNISDNAQIVHGVSYQLSTKIKTYTHLVNRMEIMVDHLRLVPGVPLYEKPPAFEPLDTPLCDPGLEAQQIYAKLAFRRLISGVQTHERGFHAAPENKNLKKTRFHVEEPVIPCSTSTNADMEKLFDGYAKYYLQDLGAEVLFLVGDQQIWDSFRKFARIKGLEERVFVVPGLFHWVAHLCLSICSICHDWLVGPLTRTMNRTFLQNLKDFKVSDFNNWEQFLLQITEALESIIIPAFQTSGFNVRTNPWNLLVNFKFQDFTNDEETGWMDQFSEDRPTQGLIYLFYWVLVPYLDMRANIRAHNSEYILNHMGYFLFVFKAAHKLKYYPLTCNFLAEYQALGSQYKKVSTNHGHN